jgi:type II secretory pathway predicted ATPase ExeA/LysM repeat protein
METEMYFYRHFNLSRLPFEMVGQPNSLYLSEAHREGMAALEWGLLHEPGSFTLLMGDVGTGKTTLINAVLSRRFFDLTRVAYIVDPKLGFEEMLRVILERLGYLPSAVTKLDLLKKFEWVFGQLRPRERIAIIIDEAQALSDETLEELRLLSNYGRDSKGHLEILLVGQPELLTRLMAPSLLQFHQRIGARAVLNRLQRDEAYEYIDHKLRDAGGTTNRIFAKNALEEIVEHSQGIPRQLNLLCNNALIRAYGAGLQRVSLNVARAAINEYENLDGAVEEFRELPLGRRILHSITGNTAIPLTGLGLLGLVGLYFLGFVGLPGRELVSRGSPRSFASTDSAPAQEDIAGAATRIVTSNDKGSERLSLSSSLTADSGVNKPAVDDTPSAPGLIPQTRVPVSGRNTQPKSHETLSYSVHSGDTVEGIARRHLGSGVKIESVIEANPQLRDVNRIYPGDTVFLPAESAQRDANGSD